MNDYRLYTDKYVPESLETVQFNHKSAEKLIACSKVVNIPHLIIKGAKGSGRKTFANLYIKEKYHLSQLSIKYQTLEIKNANKTAIALQMLYSDYHYQIDPSAHGVYDRIIVQGFVKDILQTKPVCNIPYQIIVINNADHLTFEAQQSLRRTLEKSIDYCRFIFIINQDSSLIDSLESRCIQIRLSAPTENEITQVLEHICQSEQVQYNLSQLQQISRHSNRSLSQAMILLQDLQLHQPQSLHTSHVINFEQVCNDDGCTQEIVTELLNAKTPASLMNLRLSLYKLLVQCVDPIEILKSLFLMTLDYFERNFSKSERMKHQLIQNLVKYENTLRLGSKPIYHLEGYCISVVNLLNVSS
jgi:replication factor C subunit 3/5